MVWLFNLALAKSGVYITKDPTESVTVTSRADSKSPAGVLSSPRNPVDATRENTFSSAR